MRNKQKKFLVVEDDKNCANDIIEKLSLLDFFCIHASNGNEALEILEKDPDIHYVITDLDMPVLDGFDLLNKLFLHTGFEKFHFRILVMSSIERIDFEIITRRIITTQQEFLGFLSKPVRLIDLTEILGG